MKKIIILVFMGIFTVLAYSTIYDVNASSSWENVFQVNREVMNLHECISINNSDLSDSYYSTGYETLNMGLGNTFTLYTENAINNLPYFDDDFDNINNIFILIELDEYYTSALDPYWNYTDNNISTIETNILKYDLTSSNLNNDIDITFWWAENPSYGGGGAPYNDTGSIRFISATLYVEYNEPIYTLEYDNYIDCDTDYSLLPDTNEEMIEILFMEEYDSSNNSNHIKFYLNNNIYEFNVALPEELIVDDYINLDNSYNIYFQTVNDDTESRLLIFDGGGDEKLGINLTTSEFETLKSLKLNSVINKESNFNAYMYCFYDFRIEDIMSIDISYQYRYKTLGFPSDWFTVEQTYIHDETSSIAPPRWLYAVLGIWAITTEGLYDVETIESITQSDLPNEVINMYTQNLNGSEEDLNSLNLYRIHLDQIRTLINTNYDIQDIVVQDITYVYRGVIYQATTEEIEQTNVVPELSPLFPSISDSSFDSLQVLSYVIGFVGGVIILFALYKVYRLFTVAKNITRDKKR